MSRTSFYQKNYAQWPPVKLTELADPDSYHWENSARNKKVLLIQAIGEDEYLEWIERLFPGEDNGPSNWKELSDLLEAKLLVVQVGEYEDCRCVLPEQSCPSCRAKAREVYSEDFGG